MLCAAIDIGSNTTRLLVAEPRDGQLKKVMEQRTYTRMGQARSADGVISKEKIEEVAEVVRTQVRLAEELGADTFRAVATAAIRDATNSKQIIEAISKKAGIPVSLIDGDEEGRLAFLGATKALGHPVEGRIAVVDVGGGSTEIIIGTVTDGVELVRTWPVGSGNLADNLDSGDPPSAAEIRRVRDWLDDEFKDVTFPDADQVVVIGGTANALRKMVGSLLEYETLERGIRLLSGEPAADVARRFELDPVRVRVLPTGILILEKMSEVLAQPLQIGKSGLRDGIVLDLLNGELDRSDPAVAG